MKACVLIRTRPRRYGSIARKVAKLRGVKVAFPVYGRTDVVAALNVRDLKALTRLSRTIGNLPGVLATETLVALEV